MPPGPPIAFEDLANSEEFETFFNMMWNLAGVTIGLVSPRSGEGKSLFTLDMWCPICRVINATQKGHAACRADSIRHTKEAVERRGPTHYVCHAGLWDFVFPIYVEGRHIATIEGGQMLLELPTEAGYRKLLKRTRAYGVDRRKLRKAYFSATHMSEEKLLAAVELARMFARHLSEFAYRLRQSGGDAERPEVTRAREYVDRHHHEALSLDQVAKHVNLSPAYFSSIFTRVAGMTFTSYVQQTRIERAKKLLRETSRRITGSAFEVGFNNLTHFNYVFRKREGRSPSAYRKERAASEAEA
jgi:AraC-like DNA-binding protein/ligand-binding sensor protein